MEQERNWVGAPGTIEEFIRSEMLIQVTQEERFLESIRRQLQGRPPLR